MILEIQYLAVCFKMLYNLSLEETDVDIWIFLPFLHVFRTLRPLWEMRVSPNVIYSTHHLNNDTSMLAVGGLDGVLRILNQNTGETLKSFVIDPGNTVPISSKVKHQAIEKRRVRSLSEDIRVDSIPRHLRPPITCLSVGMKKIVTTHNENFIRLWRFRG